MVPCPYIISSDRLRLTEGFILDGRGLALHDVQSTAHHTFSRQVVDIMRLLHDGASFLELSSAAKRHDIAAWELTSLLGSLNICGALRLERTLPDHMRAGYSVVSQALYGVRYPAMIWRRKASLWAIVMGVLRACRPILPAAVLLDGLLFCTQAFPAAAIASVSFLCLAVLVMSIIAHEVAHYAVIKRHAAGAAVVQKGMRVGIMHPRLSPTAAIYCALLGPLVGCMTFGGLFATSGLPAPQVFIPCGLLVHLGSLLPRYGDGATITRALTRKLPKGDRQPCRNLL